MATERIFSDGRRFHQEPPDTGETGKVNGAALSDETIESRFPGVGPGNRFDHDQQIYVPIEPNSNAQ